MGIAVDCALHFSVGDATAVCVQRAEVIDGGGAADTAEAIGDAVGSKFNTWVMPGLSEDVTFERIVIGGLTPYEWIYATDGGASLPAPSANNSFLVKKLSTGARSGRMFMPGVTEGSVDPAGAVLSAPRLAVSGAMNSWRDACIGDGVRLTVAHATGPDTPVDSFAVSGYIGLQSRRVRRR